MEDMKLMTVSSGFDGHNEDLPFFLRHLSKALRENCHNHFIASITVTRSILDKNGPEYVADTCYEAKIDEAEDE